jgi:beta-glucosidase
MRRTLALLLLLAGCTAAPEPIPDRDDLPYLDPSLPVAERVADLLGRMELADKVGQMTQAERQNVTPADVAAHRLGSVLSGGGSAPGGNTDQAWADMYDGYQRGALSTPLGIPILYGVDAVHGHQHLHGATIFPHNIGLGAAGDPDLVRAIARTTALETMSTGPTWNFAPTVAVVQDDRWGRSYESFGEDPALVAELAAAAVTGYSDAGMLACAKHFIGDGATAGGVDQGDARISEAELRATHLPPYRAAIDAGVDSIMVSFSSWNGEKVHGSHYLITELLKDELGFTGFVVSDWAGIYQVDGEPELSYADVVAAINAGIDLIMEPYDHVLLIDLLTEAVEAGDVAPERIDDAVSRILTVKFQSSLFEHPLTDRSGAGDIGSAEHRTLAREAVAASQVLLKNDGVLPLGASQRILVTGSNADDVGAQAGGWTLTWQGEPGNTIPGTSILAALDDVRDVTHSRDAPGDLGQYDVAVAVVGEKPYAEFVGDAPDGVFLSEEDQAVLSRLRDSGLPTVIVVVSGRPMILTEHLWADAIVASWLPGSEGAGVADVLTGAVPFTGALPVSWPRAATDWPINAGDGKDPLFPLGHGLR